MMNEQWKDIKGFEGIYEISNYGNVHRIGNKENRKLSPSGKGYCVIDLWKDGKQYSFKIHRLVVNTFIPNPLNKEQVNHVDGNKMNNHINNLEWVTNLENIHHAIKSGLYDNHAKGSNNGNSKLNDKLALQIYDLSINKVFPLKQICELYHMSKYAVMCIKNKKTWKHIHQ